MQFIPNHNPNLFLIAEVPEEREDAEYYYLESYPIIAFKIDDSSTFNSAHFIPVTTMELFDGLPEYVAGVIDKTTRLVTDVDGSHNVDKWYRQWFKHQNNLKRKVDTSLCTQALFIET
ncbi:hypothetical protein [Vibrio campbellii]|uniref:hypothetical protein n=1 Tax=Vibrio campbellii TaxID=680 RepID=UPI001F1EDCED|nr:hypothetical protein [Vibrio campbellii]MCE7729611.1 hypothetical protein [Vibrio campbellii]